MDAVGTVVAGFVLICLALVVITAALAFVVFLICFILVMSLVGIVLWAFGFPITVTEKYEDEHGNEITIKHRYRWFTQID